MDNTAQPKHRPDFHRDPESVPAPDKPAEDWCATGKTIAESQSKTTKDFGDDIIDAAIYLRSNTYFGRTDELFAAVDAYLAAIRQADKEGR